MGALFKFISPIFLVAFAIVLFAALLFSSDYFFEKLTSAIKPFFKAPRFKKFTLPVGVVMAVGFAFAGFFTILAKNPDVENIQVQSAESQKLISDKITKLKDGLSATEAKSFEAAYDFVLSSRDSGIAPARAALMSGRIEDAAAHMLKIAPPKDDTLMDRMREAANYFWDVEPKEKNISRSKAQESYRAAGALYLLINKEKARDSYLGAIEAGSTEGWDYIHAARLYFDVGSFRKAKEVLLSARALPISAEAKNFVGWELAMIAVEQEDQAQRYHAKGEALLLQGDAPMAQSYFNMATELGQGLIEIDPTFAQYQHDLAVNYNKLAEVSLSQGDLTQGYTYLRRALEIIETLAESDPTDARHQRNLLVSYFNIAQADPNNTLQWLMKAKAVGDKLRTKNQLDPGYVSVLEGIETRIADLEKPEP